MYQNTRPRRKYTTDTGSFHSFFTLTSSATINCEMLPRRTSSTYKKLTKVTDFLTLIIILIDVFPQVLSDPFLRYLGLCRSIQATDLLSEMFTTLLVGLFPLARGLQLISMCKGNDGLKVIWPENLRKLPSQEASA